MKGASTRERILNCTLELFYKKGYDAVGVQEISDTVGITKPTLYYYFGSKKGLLESLFETKCKPFNQNLKKAAQFEGDLPKTLHCLASAYLTAGASDQTFYFFMIALFYSARNNEAYQSIKGYMVEQYKIFVGVFEAASKQLGNMRGRQEQFAIGFAGLLNSYLLVRYEVSKTIEITDEVVFSIIHQFMHGIHS